MHDDGHVVDCGPVLSHREVAEIMTERGYPMSWQAARDTELRALGKLKVLLEGMPDVDLSCE